MTLASTSGAARRADTLELGAAPVAPRRLPQGSALVIAVALFGLAAIVGYEAWRVSARAVAYGLGPTAFPAAVAIVLALLAAGTLFAAFRGTFPEPETDEEAPILWIVLGLILQMVLLPIVGFSIATGILFAATACGMGRREVWMSLPIGIALCLFLWAVFSQLLNLSLPAGHLETQYLALQPHLVDALRPVGNTFVAAYDAAMAAVRRLFFPD